MAAFIGVDVLHAVRDALAREADGQTLFRAYADVCDFVGDHDGEWPKGWAELDER